MNQDKYWEFEGSVEQVPKGAASSYAVSYAEKHGKQYVVVREFVTKDNVATPGKQGMNIPFRCFDALIAAMQLAKNAGMKGGLRPCTLAGVNPVAQLG